MDEYGLPAKFMKFLVAECCTLNTMSLPTSFCVKYGEHIPPYVTLVLRNGEELIIEYAKDEGVFVGMTQIFEKLDCSDGCIFAFQYNGGDNFLAHVISSGLELHGDVKIGFPIRTDIVDDSGCKFVQIMASTSVHWGKFVLPPKFADRFGPVIPPNLKFSLRNGIIVEGSYDKIGKAILGLQQVFRLTCLTLLDTLLFTYYGDGVFAISAFGGNCVEKPVRLEETLLDCKVGLFEIEVKPSHLLKYCLGVYISSKYQKLTKKWKEYDRIKVCHGSRSWVFQVKKRDKQTKIHQGWTNFRTDLDLCTGDYCVFKRGKNRRRFDVEVYKKVL